MAKTLILSLHPEPTKSVRCNMILKQLKSCGSYDIRVVADHIKDFKMTEEQVKNEQSIWIKYQKIVFLFPLYWYQMPAYSKAYIDQMLTYGFTFGSKATMKGRELQVIITTGSPREKYDVECANIVTKPYSTWASFMGWKCSEPIIFYNDDTQIDTSKV